MFSLFKTKSKVVSCCFDRRFGERRFVDVHYVFAGRERSVLVAMEHIIPSRTTYVYVHDYPISMVDVYMSARDIIDLFKSDSN